jgi:hypothetical protein
VDDETTATAAVSGSGSGMSRREVLGLTGATVAGAALGASGLATGVAAAATPASLPGVPPDPKVYHSSMELRKMTQLLGNPDATIATLEQQLAVNRIDPDPALRGLPPGNVGKLEAVARLVALARANGFAVLLEGAAASSGALEIKVVSPASVHLLQCSHAPAP